METLKFGFRPSADRTRNFLAISVPPRIQEGLDFQYEKLQKEIRRSPKKIIKIVAENANQVYVIDHRAIGGATLIQRTQALRKTMDWIHATQFIAQKTKLLDPMVQMLPAMSPHLGVYPLAAKVRFTPELKTAPAQHAVLAMEQMMEVHKDLFNPHGDDEMTASHVHAKFDLQQGVEFQVGLSTFGAPITNIEQPQLVFNGAPRSHDEALVLMAGAVKLAQAVKS